MANVMKIICIILALGILGCTPTPKNSPRPEITSPWINKYSNDLTAIAGRLKSINETMDSEFDAYAKDQNPQHITNIRTEVTRFGEVLSDLFVTTGNISSLEKKTKDIEAWGIEQQKEKDIAWAVAQDETNSKLRFYGIGCLLCAVGAAAGAVYAHDKRLFYVSGTLFVGSVACFTMIKWLPKLEFGIIVIAVILVAVVVYELAIKKKTITQLKDTVNNLIK